MGLHVVVVDPLPMFRHGAEAVLSAAGHVVDALDDVPDWARYGHDGVVLLSLLTEHDWELLARLGEERSVTVVALIEEHLLESGPAVVGARAVLAGATAVLPRSAAAAVLVRAVEATADNQSVLPVAVVAALANGSPAPRSALSVEQLSWLRQLSAGSTVAQLADRAGYSEREMFRLLKSVYREMGVAGRMQAILRAQELGWLSADG